jgi:pSer/pThr/pTyr-binding forkhead associated (FHA) protein
MTDHIIVDGQLVPLTAQRYLIGRGEGCEVLLPEDDPAVSRRHALLERDKDGNWSIVDLGSRNGTTINSAPIEDRQVLKDGDAIAIGKSKIVLWGGGGGGGGARFSPNFEYTNMNQAKHYQVIAK